MSLEEIKKRIDSEARADAERIKDEGKAEAEAIMSTSRNQASDILEAAKEQAEHESSRMRKELLSGAEIEASTMLIAARESVIEGHIGAVKSRVARMLSDSKQCGKLIEGAAQEFEKLAARKDMVVRVDRKWLAQVRRLGYVAEAGSDGELTMATRDGSVTLDASPMALAEKYEREARSSLSSRLFGSDK
jgi:vacuolar-type H+-ATPase subunit E/Vma4